MSWLLKVTHIWVTFFNKKGRLLYWFHLCLIFPGISTLIILGRIIGGEKTLPASTIQCTYGVLGPYGEPRVMIGENNFLKRKEDKMGDKGKKDKGRREDQKKSKQTLKEKRKQKKDKTKSVWESEK
jgi:hypothetical protein